MEGNDGLTAVCARLAREKGWPDSERERLARLLDDEDRRRTMPDHPRRFEFLARALAEMLDRNGAPGGTAGSGPDELEVRVVALMMAEGLAPPDR